VPRPTIVIEAGCPPQAALSALAEALIGEGFHLKPATDPLHLEASRISWLELLSAALPSRAVVVAHATATPTGTSLRVHHPSGDYGWGGRRRAVRILEETMRRLRATGVPVSIGRWESGLAPRRSETPDGR
jgi:hypothetical protein